MNDEVKVRIRVSTDKLKSATYRTVTFDREEWEGMSVDDQDVIITDYVFGHGMCEIDFEEV